jgi:hypothetical protein
MCDFINNIKGYCSQDFPGTVLTSNIEIVLVEQEQIPGQPAEDADALALDDTETFYDKYISRNVFPSFYIRNTINIIPETDDAERNQRTRQEEDAASTEAERARQEQEQNIICMICLENNVSRLRLTCSHELCRTCFNTCLNYGHHRCPLCRRNTVFRDMVH